MQIKDSRATIEINSQEAWEISYCINGNLLRAIESHYNQLQQDKDGEDLFFQQENTKLYILSNMCAVAGHIDAYESYISDYRSRFQKRRLEREKED